MTTTVNPKARHRARRLALQALYQWQISGDDLAALHAQYHTHTNMTKVDIEFFNELLHKIPADITEVEASFAPYLDRDITELNPIELTILRIGSYELKYRPDIPYKVVIDEALRLAQTYGSTDSHKYVNAVLDKVSKQLRSLEIG